MAQEQMPPSGPDLTKGVGLGDFKDDKLLGHVGDDEVLLVRSGGEIFAVGAHCSHYHGPLAEGLVDRRQRALPLASRLFRSAHRRGGAGAGAQPDRLLDGGTARRPHLCHAKARAAEAARHGGEGGYAEKDRHRRRRRGRLCGGRNAAPARLWRQHRHGEQRCRAAGRPAQSVQGLSRRQRAGGLAAAAAGRFLWRKQNRLAACHRSRRDRYQAAPSPLRQRREPRLRPAVAGDRRRAGAAAGSRRRSAARPYAALARRLPRHHRRHEGRQARAGYRRELHRARSGGGAAHPRYRGPCRGAGSAADGARARAAARRLHSRAARGARRRFPSR